MSICNIQDKYQTVPIQTLWQGTEALPHIAIEIVMADCRVHISKQHLEAKGRRWLGKRYARC